MSKLVAQDFLSSEEIERLRELEELARQEESELKLRREAWRDLRSYSVTDLDTFITLSAERRESLSKEYTRAYEDHSPSGAYYTEGLSEEERTRQLYKWRASEEVYRFYKETIPLDHKMKRLRVRGEVAEEILERNLYGYEIPDSPPNAEDSLVTPLSKYEPSDEEGGPLYEPGTGAKEILQAVARLDMEREDLAEVDAKNDIWRLVHSMIEEGELNDNALKKLNGRLQADMEDKGFGDRFPHTPEELVTLAREHPDIDPFDMEAPTTL